MLPQDTKECKKAAIDKECGDCQSSVTEHFGPEDPDTKSIPYSDKALETAVLEWLIETNQVCDIVTFPPFLILICTVIIANSGVWEHCIQEAARYCVPSNPKHQIAVTQAIEGVNHQNVQAADVTGIGCDT
jgi:hypothetical protein